MFCAHIAYMRAKCASLMMTAVSEMKGNQSNFKKALYVLIPILVIGGGVSGYLAYASAAGTTSLAPAKSGTNALANTKVEFSVAITHQDETFANVVWMTQMALKGQYWSASCYAFCHGVTYRLDPTITTQGTEYLQCRIFGSDPTLGSNCASTYESELGTVIGVSAQTSGTGTSDSYSSGACSSSDMVSNLSSGNPETGTVTAGTAASGSVTTTIAYTFTATGSVSNAQVACLLTATSNYLVVADGTFGPDTLSSGNTLTITWSITTS